VSASIRTYAILGIVVVVSLGMMIFFHFFPVSVIGDLAGIPAVVALFGALFKLGRDSIAHERKLHLQEAENLFTIGATSHMANVAFEKRVSFCQEYTDAVNAALEMLFIRGAHEAALDEANNLLNVRLRWNLWLPLEIQTELIKFEGALREIGSQSWLLRELGPDEDRREVAKKAHRTFAAVMGWKTWQNEPVTEDVAAEKIIEGLQQVLGIRELTRMRTTLVNRAIAGLE
jgi:hypothetical protein